MYKIDIVIKNNGFILIDKSLKCETLEGILGVNPSDLYAEAQQREIKEGLDLYDEYEEEDIYS